MRENDPLTLPQRSFKLVFDNDAGTLEWKAHENITIIFFFNGNSITL